MYRVLCDFADLTDENHVYRAGDEYPREGLEPTAARIKELSGKTNKLGKPLIKKQKKAD